VAIQATETTRNKKSKEKDKKEKNKLMRKKEKRGEKSACCLYPFREGSFCTRGGRPWRAGLTRGREKKQIGHLLGGFRLLRRDLN